MRIWLVHFQKEGITAARDCKPVLTGGSVIFCVFQGDPWGQTPQPIVTQNGLNEADFSKDVLFGVKIETFCTT